MPSPNEIESLLARRAALQREARHAIAGALDETLANPAVTVELAVTIRNPGSPPARTVVISSDREAVAAIIKAHRGSADQQLDQVERALAGHGIKDAPLPNPNV